MPTHFENHSDRRAWRAYAAAALSNLGAFEPVGDAVSAVARIADLMLEEERRRRAESGVFPVSKASEPKLAGRWRR